MLMVVMSDTRYRISEILETHFCDAPDTEKYETQLRENVREYLSRLDLDKLVEYHKALGDENRLGIMRLLEFREMCVCELAAALGISQPNLTHHVKKLERAGLVKSDKRGKWVYYSLQE
jgi:ArsR family transcriptional regulator